jgi:hypothetical protein
MHTLDSNESFKRYTCKHNIGVLNLKICKRRIKLLYWHTALTELTQLEFQLEPSCCIALVVNVLQVIPHFSRGIIRLEIEKHGGSILPRTQDIIWASFTSHFTYFSFSFSLLGAGSIPTIWPHNSFLLTKIWNWNT